MDELLKDYASEYQMGFVTYMEFAERVALSPTKEGEIVREALDEMRMLDEYWKIKSEFDSKIGELPQSDRRIASVLGYLELMNK